MQATIVRGADRPHFHNHSHERFLDSIGDFPERTLSATARDGVDAVAVITTQELHPGATPAVPVVSDQAKRTGDPSGANVALHDLQRMLQRRPQTGFEDEARLEVGVTEKALAQAGQVGRGQMGSGTFEDLLRRRSTHTPFLQRAGKFEEGFGVEAAVTQCRVYTAQQLVYQLFGSLFGVHAAVLPIA
ncbi:hypothetical protein [Nonomuraea sp. NPDC005501]|uniref:hypothetical protein n=1 Tax=Nonomuraea sp. NPDC005501 TaxID=3156884 RepID=UPI0033B2D0E1